MVELTRTYTSFSCLTPRWAAAMFLIWLGGCVAGIEQQHPLDGRLTTAEIIGPVDQERLDERLPALTILFSDAIDPRRGAPERAVSLTHGRLAVPVRVAIDPLARTLVARPVDPLVPTLRYVWEVDHERLRGAGGRSVEDIDPVSFVVAENAQTQTPPTASPPNWNQVTALLQARCGGCHDDAPLDALSYERLLDRSAQRDARRIVEPFAPERSYLIEKVIPDYPDRMGAVMPPPWEPSPLANHEIRLLYDWIAAGATR